jgi:hypothetical protein
VVWVFVSYRSLYLSKLRSIDELRCWHVVLVVFSLFLYWRTLLKGICDKNSISSWHHTTSSCSLAVYSYSWSPRYDHFLPAKHLLYRFFMSTGGRLFAACLSKCIDGVVYATWHVWDDVNTASSDRALIRQSSCTNIRVLWSAVLKVEQGGTIELISWRHELAEDSGGFNKSGCRGNVTWFWGDIS